ncbi:MAG TPA: endonuclease/exonuclease/phosphatase family protein [Tepidisphaeraceae bacterium]|nr:endonuclease/exonuclease/phosphatase family protein [Tepidisphaeraceae bacterium]
MLYCIRAAALAAAFGLALFTFGCSSHETTPSIAFAPIPSSNTMQSPVINALTDGRPRGEFRVMTFNVRVITFLDVLSFTTWDSRKAMLAHTIREVDPDILGTQECLAEQSDYLRQQLPEYGFVGVGRDDGYRGGEMCGIFFKSARFDKLAYGHFWLSEKPTQPGSKSWGTAWTRMVTWIKLAPRDGSQPICVFNTHFDVFGSRARLESAKLLRAEMDAIAPNMPCIITGDFNDSPNSPPYQILLAGGQLTDAFRAVHPSVAKNEGTEHGFSGKETGTRIDWIVTNAAFQPISANIIHTHQGGKFPSDHFPVTVVVKEVAPLPVARIE